MLPPHLTHRQKPRATAQRKRVPFFRLLATSVTTNATGATRRVEIKPRLPILKSRLRVLSR